MVLADSYRVPLPRTTQDTVHYVSLRVRDYHPLWSTFPSLFYFVTHKLITQSYNPRSAVTTWFGLFRVRSPLLTESLLFFSSSRYLDVSVLRVCSPGYYTFNLVGCPIRTSSDHSLFATPRSLSQLITSFVASESLGIPHTPLFSFLLLPLVLLFLQ